MPTIRAISIVRIEAADSVKKPRFYWKHTEFNGYTNEANAKWGWKGGRLNKVGKRPQLREVFEVSLRAASGARVLR